jgi:hypothetical protein
MHFRAGTSWEQANWEDTLMDWWLQAKQQTPKQLGKGLASAVLLNPWMIWKHRNDYIFQVTPTFCPLPDIEDQG